MVYRSTSCYFLFSTTLHMRIAFNTASAQGVKSLGHDNNAGIVMSFRVCIPLKKWSKHFLLIIFTEKNNDSNSWSCLARQARPLTFATAHNCTLYIINIVHVFVLSVYTDHCVLLFCACIGYACHLILKPFDKMGIGISSFQTASEKQCVASQHSL